MIEGEPRRPLHLQPGPERRAWMRTMNIRWRGNDFSHEEWVEIEAEAPGMAADLKAMFDDSVPD